MAEWSASTSPTVPQEAGGFPPAANVRIPPTMSERRRAPKRLSDAALGKAPAPPPRVVGAATLDVHDPVFGLTETRHRSPERGRAARDQSPTSNRRRQMARQAQRIVDDNRVVDAFKEKLKDIFGRSDVTETEARRIAHERQKEHDRAARRKQMDGKRLLRAGAAATKTLLMSGTLEMESGGTFGAPDSDNAFLPALPVPPSRCMPHSARQHKKPGLPDVFHRKDRDSLTARVPTRPTEGRSVAPRPTYEAAQPVPSQARTRRKSQLVVQANRDPMEETMSASALHNVLPEIAPNDHAAAFIRKRMDTLRTDPQLRRAFMRGVNRERAKVSEKIKAHHAANAAALDRFLEAHKDVGALTERARTARDEHQQDVRARKTEHYMQAQHDAAERQAAFDARAATADTNRELHLERPHRVRQWLTLLSVIAGFQQIRKVSNRAVVEMRARWPRVLPSLLAAYWLFRARRSKASREELRRNVILGKQLPAALQRVRQRMYASPANMVRRVMRDVCLARSFATVVHRYLKNVNRTQRIVRRHLLARSLWQTALLLSWEARVKEAVLGQFNATYPRDAVKWPEYVGKWKGALHLDAATNPSFKGAAPAPAVLVDSAVHAIMHQRDVQFCAVKRVGLPNIVADEVCPPAPQSPLTPGRRPPRSTQDAVVAFVPRRYRVHVVKHLIAKAVHQHSRRLIAADARAKGLGVHRKDMPVPPLQRFVDKGTMRRLVHLVETKVAQAASAALLQAEADAERAARHAAALAGEAGDDEGMITVAGLRQSMQPELSSPLAASSDSSLTMSATAVFDQQMAEELAREAMLYAPAVDDTPNARDKARALTLIEALAAGFAPPVIAYPSESDAGSQGPLGSDMGDSDPAAVLSRPESIRRRVRLRRNDEHHRDADPNGPRVPMSVGDAAAELTDCAAATVLPPQLSYVERFAAGY